MIVKLLSKHHLEFLSFKGVYTDSSESILVKTPHCHMSWLILCGTVHSEIFARVLFSRNFAYAEFRENISFVKW